MEFSEDSIEEILLKLPIKTLMRFKRVSKQWLGLIASHTFAFRQHTTSKAHVLDNPAASFFVLRTPEATRVKRFITLISVNLVNGVHELEIHRNIDLPRVGNDEIPPDVLFPAGFGIYCVFQYGAALLWNPTTRQTNLVPPSPYFHGQHYPHNFGLVGYEDGNFSYKVGRVSSNWVSSSFRHQSLSLELYWSETKSWKLMPDFCIVEGMRVNMWMLHSVNLNGRAHWLILADNGDHYIISFDYKTEVFGKIKVPLAPEVGSYITGQQLITSYDDKFLCVMLRWSNNNKWFLDVWVMRKYGVEDSWRKEYTVGPNSMNMEMLGFCSRVQGILLRRDSPMRTQLFFRDCKPSKCKRFHRIGADQEEHMQVVEFSESLVSLE